MRLWRNQAFAVFWSARTISFAGTGITMVVLPVLVYGMTGSPAWVASLGLIEAVPYLSFGLLAGAVADHMNRKKIMVGCDEDRGERETCLHVLQVSIGGAGPEQHRPHGDQAGDRRAE